MRRILSITFLISLALATTAKGAFQATQVNARWSGFNDDPSGIASFEIEGVSTTGQVIAVSYIRGIGRGSIGPGTSQMSFYGDPPGQPTFSDQDAIVVPTNLSAVLEVDGVQKQVSAVGGSFDIFGPSEITTGVTTGSGPNPMADSGSVNDIPVTFAIDFQIISGSDVFDIQGTGTGTADLDFATWAPSHNLVLQTRSSYDLAVTQAVPEPTGLVVWGGCIASGAALVALRRRSKQR